MTVPFALEVETRNGVMGARLTHDSVTLWLAPGCYTIATRASLAERIAEIGALVGARRDAAFRAALERRHGVSIDPGHHAIGARASALRALEARLVSEGGSPDSLVHVRALGLLGWQVDVAPEVPHLVSQDWFLDAASHALTEAVRHHLEAVPLLAAQQRTGASDADVARARELLALARER